MHAWPRHKWHAFLFKKKSVMHSIVLLFKTICILNCMHKGQVQQTQELTSLSQVPFCHFGTFSYKTFWYVQILSSYKLRLHRWIGYTLRSSKISHLLLRIYFAVEKIIQKSCCSKKTNSKKSVKNSFMFCFTPFHNLNHPPKWISSIKARNSDQ